MLHGYGATETQFSTLLPIDLPVVTVVPRAPHEVEPGFGWWTPKPVPAENLIDLAPIAAVDAAVARVVEIIDAAQTYHRFSPSETVLVGYSQGSSLALSVAARYPERIAAVASIAGFLLPAEHVRTSPDPLQVLIMNGSFDSLTSPEVHQSSINRFAEAGHEAAGHIDAVPHVVDDVQVERTLNFITQSVKDGG